MGQQLVIIFNNFDKTNDTKSLHLDLSYHSFTSIFAQYMTMKHPSTSLDGEHYPPQIKAWKCDVEPIINTSLWTNFLIYFSKLPDKSVQSNTSLNGWWSSTIVSRGGPSNCGQTNNHLHNVPQVATRLWKRGTWVSHVEDPSNNIWTLKGNWNDIIQNIVILVNIILKSKLNIRGNLEELCACTLFYILKTF